MVLSVTKNDSERFCYGLAMGCITAHLTYRTLVVGQSIDSRGVGSSIPDLLNMSCYFTHRRKHYLHGRPKYKASLRPHSILQGSPSQMDAKLE